MSGSRVIIHVDLDYFFAQCEERENPSLRGRPVVVCVYSGRSEDSGAVSTANYVARKYGVHSGMPIYLAKRRLTGTEAAFLPLNRSLYAAVSEAVMGILRGYADRFEQVSIDEAFLDVSERVGGNFDAAISVGRGIKDEILKREGLTCSVGVGSNKLVAKMAAGFQKPDGLTVVRPEEVRGFLSKMPVGKLYGVGRKTEPRMREMGIATIGDLAAYDVGELVRVFGVVLGKYFRNAANGIDEETVQERGTAEQVSRIATLKQDTRDLDVMLEIVYQLAEVVHRRVVELGRRFRAVAIMAVYEDLSIHSRSKTLEGPTDDPEVLRRTSKELLERLLKEDAGLRVRRVGVRVSSLEERKGQRVLTEFTSDPR